MFHLSKRLCTLMLAIFLLGTALPAFAAQDALHVLLIGVDSAGNAERGRSDAMILARIEPAQGSIRLVSFLRDLYVHIDGVGKTRLNAAYYHGGEALLKTTLEKNFDIAIDRTVTVDFSILCDLVDELGGVEIDIQEKERKHLNDIISDYNSAYGLTGGRIANAGLQRLDGRQALCYSRIRKIDSDFQRTSRQQALIGAMLQQMGTLDKWRLMKLALHTISRVQTDLSFSDLMLLAPLFPKLAQLELQTLHIPYEGVFRDETVNGMMVLSADIAQCKARLHSFLTGAKK